MSGSPFLSRYTSASLNGGSVVCMLLRPVRRDLIHGGRHHPFRPFLFGMNPSAFRCGVKWREIGFFLARISNHFRMETVSALHPGSLGILARLNLFELTTDQDIDQVHVSRIVANHAIAHSPFPK
ncbi:hypothetical protein WP1_146 [Pseudomonas phage WP1]